MGGGLLDEALGAGSGSGALASGHVVLVEDCVETSGAFLLHHLLKRALGSSPNPLDGGGGGAAVFLAFAQPFSHYDRVLRKMGCNLSLQRKNNKLHFFDLLEFPGAIKEDARDHGLLQLYGDIRKAVGTSRSKEWNPSCTIMVDDISLLEIAAHGSVEDVLDFLHYCVALTSEMGCSLIILIHEDIYSSEKIPGLLSHLHYLANVVIKAGPLNTGLASDVHGQLTVVNKGMLNDYKRSIAKVWNFHFRVKENGVEFFYPGSRQ